MIFDFLRKKKRQSEDEDWGGGYAPLKEQPERDTADDPGSRRRSAERRTAQTVRKIVTGRRHVVELCEEIIDSSRELENTRSEYQQVTSQLNDIMLWQELSEQERAPILETARQIQKLDETRAQLLKNEKQLTDTQFAQMQEEEDEVPTSVKRLKSNEAYLDAIKRDMHYLEGEKVEWTILKQECEREQIMLRRIAVLLLALFSIAVLVLLVVRYYMDYDIQLMLLIAAFITTLIGAYVLLKYQDCTKEIKRCDVNCNQAILLENRVKLKFVNIKNAVDYTCEKYHVKNSYELTYMYEKFQAAVKEQERFKQTNDDLVFYTEKLTGQLEQLHLFDASFWAHDPMLLLDEKKMEAVRKDFTVRRQKLRSSMEDSLTAIDSMKREVLNNTRYMGEISEQVKQILQKIDELNHPLQP